MGELLIIFIAIVAFLSAFPSDLSRKWKCISVYYPLVGIIFFMAYERQVETEFNPESVPIRIDKFMLVPAMAFIILMGLSRWALVGMALSNSSAKRGHPRRAGIQIVLAVLWALVCLFWVVQALLT
jgi:hypothetical protein